MDINIESKPYSSTEYYKGSYGKYSFSLMVDVDEDMYNVEWIDLDPIDNEKAEAEIIKYFKENV